MMMTTLLALNVVSRQVLLQKFQKSNVCCIFIWQVREFIETTKAKAHARGEVRTMAGRRRPLKAIQSADRR